MAKNDPFSAPASATTGTDPFGDPAAGTARPKMKDMYDRLLLISPEKVDQQPSLNDPSKMVDRLTATVVVLDGGVFPFGGDLSETPPIPHTVIIDADELPYKIDSMYVSAVGIVNQCRDALDARERKTGKPTMVLGRLKKGEQKDPTRKAPWRLEKATDADKEIARAYINSQNPFSS